DTITSQDLDKEINEEFGNFDSLIMDFTELEYISSAGLRVLIATQKKLKAEDIPFVIKNVNDTVGEIFRMSGFDKILKIE
ncbi:MAG: STAS domain-containing protein, partial [Methanobrevibacter sp.]|nr:STAS domain-containing protein [Methanobrevibacter sp.]